MQHTKQKRRLARQIAAMPHFSLRLFAVCCLANLLFGSYASGAAAQPVIGWVTPPVWLQTQTENTSAPPGTTLTKQAWISTGRGGKAMILLGDEQVEINENSLWEWSGRNDGNTGNAVQGGMRVSTAIARSLPVEVQTADQTVRLYPDAPWQLLLDAGRDPVAAEGLVNYLRNSGYPVSEAQKIKHFFGDKWHIALNGFASEQAAAAMSHRLIALAPGIHDATVKLRSGEASATAPIDSTAPVALEASKRGPESSPPLPAKAPGDAPEEAASPASNTSRH